MIDLVPGMRVVVRYLIHSGQATDALGMLLSADEHTLTVDGKHGVVTIDRTAIVAAKQVPPAPVRRAPRQQP
ncbi:hypothetical protein [uncultured Microbacterium sp.]|uniref:putative acetyltransferase n=1 Tax=uncultured Microbacterium sp. TaxID=191216 RepID=UPI0026062E49|nr:hypothetical protein [uncultured Microbacterium sp.]